MRTAPLLALAVAAAACGSKSTSPTRSTTPPRGASVPAGGPILFVAVSALPETRRDVDLLPLACQGGPDGVHGGRACLDDLEGDLGAVLLRGGGAEIARLADGGAASNPCQDQLGAATVGFSIENNVHVEALELGVWPASASADLQLVPATPLAPGTPLELDLDGDGAVERIAISAAGLELVDGRDPLMTDRLDPFPDAAQLTVRATTDLDGDRRRELVIVATHPSGAGLAVIEYWGNGEAYRLDCRAP